MALLAAIAWFVASRNSAALCFRTSILAGTKLSSKATTTALFSQPNKFDPFRMMSNVVGSGLLRRGEMGSKPEVDKALLDIPCDSWSNIRTRLESRMETDRERNFRSNLKLGYGIGSPLHKIRLFNNSNQEKDIRVIFYRDSASWCPYCQKVWLMLEEKKVPYRVEKINMSCYGSKPASFYLLQPSGQIPVAEIDGRIYGQSNDIMFALEEKFTPDLGFKSLLPQGEREKARELLRLERELFSAWMYWLTGGGTRSKDDFIRVLNRVENTLKNNGPFFLGEQVTLVDFMFASFLERMAASLLYFKGFFIRVIPGEATKYPAVNRWFDAMETLESYQLTKSDYYTHCWDLPPQLGGCVSEAGCEPYQRAINGEQSLVDSTRGSWELPLEAHNGGVEPDWTWAAADEATAKREAVERVTGNFYAIVQFACRGAGKKGIPPVSAPLADPNAIPSKAVENAVDVCLRTICRALLATDPDDFAKQQESMVQTAQVVSVGGAEFTQGVIDSLAYVRDRIGVPRDMKLPAARQLRAHLNWAIRILASTRDQSEA